MDLSLFTLETTSGQLDFSYYANQVEAGVFAGDEAALAIEADACRDVPALMQTLQLDNRLASEVARLFQHAIDAGLGQQSIAALSTVLTSRS